MYERMKKLALNATANLIDQVEDAMNKDSVWIDALSSSFSLLVMSDKVAEEKEKEAVSEYLLDLPIVLERKTHREISLQFLKGVEDLEAGAKKDHVHYNMVVADLLSLISKAKDCDEVDVIADTVALVTSGGSEDADEIKMRERILRALGR